MSLGRSSGLGLAPVLGITLGAPIVLSSVDASMATMALPYVVDDAVAFQVAGDDCFAGSKTALTARLWRR